MIILIQISLDVIFEMFCSGEHTFSCLQTFGVVISHQLKASCVEGVICEVLTSEIKFIFDLLPEVAHGFQDPLSIMCLLMQRQLGRRKGGEP